MRERGHRRAEGARPVDGGRAADAAPCRMLIALSAVLRAAAFLVERRVGLALALVEVGRCCSGPSSTISTRSPACASSSALMPAPAPLPTMATSHSIKLRQGPCGPPSTRQPRDSPFTHGIGQAAHGGGGRFRCPCGPDSPVGPGRRIGEVRRVGQVAQRVVGLLSARRDSRSPAETAGWRRRPLRARARATRPAPRGLCALARANSCSLGARGGQGSHDSRVRRSAGAQHLRAPGRSARGFHRARHAQPRT